MTAVLKVFVSSTFEDMVDHRKAVDNIIGRLCGQFRGMELFGSRPFEPKAVSFAEIAEAQLFIGIYGHRYGWIPEGDTLSITEQEFDEARRLNKHCYCYVVDPDHPWNPTQIEISALDKLKRFHTKVGTLVRSRFTTPDNLAKQVAADLVAAFSAQRPTQNLAALREQLRTNIAHEIATTVGTKYIRDLYVGRALDRNLRLKLEQPARTSSTLIQVRESVTNVLKSIELLACAKPITRDVSNDRELVDRALSQLSRLADLRTMAPDLNYPAHELTDALTVIRSFLSKVGRLHASEVRYGDHDVGLLRQLGSHVDTASTATAEALHTIKPVYLIIDRAGGGKTNLLCHLAESMAHHQPTFFITARSVVGSSCDAILQYLSSVYPFGPDPVSRAIEIPGDDAISIVIVDGLNEHPDPRAFNAGIKDFIRRYYDRPVKFLFSCRDIYWRYFEDDWWLAHSATVSRDALYEFTTIEYRQALRLYLNAFDIHMQPTGIAREELRHPLLLRFFCEAYRGTPSLPTRLGVIHELRLLELFDAYCDKKFEQIRSRLGLADADEIVAFLKMLAIAMVTDRSRTLPVNAVAQKALAEFGERRLKAPDSRYLQILDEDILLEERPVDNLTDTVVGFVYDEFMEYMIASALWSRSQSSTSGDIVDHISAETNALLSIRGKFISVTGIILYFGEMLSRLSEQFLLRYLDQLIELEQFALACNIAARISRVRPRQSVFQKVLELHGNGKRLAKHYALDAMEQLATSHWVGLLNYFASPATELPSIAARRAFTILRHASVRLAPDDQFAAVEFIQRAIAGEHARVIVESEVDIATGVNTIREVAARCNRAWSADRIGIVMKWLSTPHVHE